MADATPRGAFLTLPEALARLPLAAPGQSAWPALADRLAARRRRPRWPFALAAAAALLAIALIPRHAPVAMDAVTAVTTDADLSALMDESARLERLLGAARDDGASSASAAAMSLTLEDRLAVVDATLQGQHDPARQRALWRQRILLLRQAASLETSRHYLAANGQRLDVTLVAAY